MEDILYPPNLWELHLTSLAQFESEFSGLSRIIMTQQQYESHAISPSLEVFKQREWSEVIMSILGFDRTEQVSRGLAGDSWERWVNLRRLEQPAVG